MNNEFKKLSQGDVTRYVLESDGGTTSSGSIASNDSAGFKKGLLLTPEGNKKAEPPKTRNPVAKNAGAAIGGGAAGAHKDKKKNASVPRKEKHKKPFMENHDGGSEMNNMALGELRNIVKNSKDIFNKLSQGGQLDTWEYSYITVANDHLDSVAEVLINGQDEQSIAEGEGDPEGVDHLSKELLTHIVDQVGTEGAHAVIKSLEWGDGASKELLHLIVKDLKQDIGQGVAEGHGAMDLATMDKISHSVKAWNNADRNVEQLITQGHTIKFYPDKIEIFKGGELIYSKDGNFSNVTNGLVVRAKNLVSNLIYKSKQGVAEAFQNDESNLFYIYDKSSGRLKQRMIQNLDEPKARSAGYRDSVDDALKHAGIIRSKFDQKKFIQNQGGKWVQVFPFGEQGMAEGSYDDDDTSMSEKLHDLLQQGMNYKQAVNLVAKTYNTYPEYVVGTYNRWGNHNHDPYDDFGEQGVAEEWSKKYKSSINCSHPKGFSQKAHCAGKKKHNEDITMEMTCPDCGMCKTHGNLSEIKKGAKDSNGYTSCWSGYHAAGTKKSATTGKQVRNCVPNEGMEEGWDDIKKFGKKAAVAGAIGLGMGAAAAGGFPSDVPAGGHNQLPDIVAHVTFKVGDKEVSKEINLGSHYRSPGEAGEELKNFLQSKGIKFYQYSLERVTPKADDKIDSSPATSGMVGGMDTSEPAATGPSTDNYMAKDNDPERGPSMGGKFTKESSDSYFESLTNKLAEKLDPNAPVDDWVQDFAQANPEKHHQFRQNNRPGTRKPEKKIERMAQAASYAAKTGK